MERMDLIIFKDHLDPDDKLSDEEWKEFVEECSDRLFDCCLVEGQDLLEDWSITNLNKLNRDLSIDQIVKLNDWNRERNEQNETVT